MRRPSSVAAEKAKAVAMEKEYDPVARAEADGSTQEAEMGTSWSASGTMANAKANTT